MNLLRRQFLHLAAGAVALPAASRIASAQAYPTRPVHLISGYPAGGGTDVVARLIGQRLSEQFGQPFVVENRVGADTNLATEDVIRSAPDGHTLLMVSTANAINASLYDKLSFNFLRDIAPVAGVVGAPFVMTVNPSIPAKTVPEFIAYAQANPGKINMAASAAGPNRLAGELFKMMAGVDMLHVPYRGDAPALSDVIAGHVQATFASVPSSIGYIKSGSLRGLAVTSATRSEAAPDVPVMSEFLPNYDANAFYGVGAPKNTPIRIIEMLNREIQSALADPSLTVRLAELGYTTHPLSSADFSKLIADETEKWAKVVKFAGMKPD
jgi:tripartite-type tricarboxylate transporter receptor subunit TctC